MTYQIDATFQGTSLDNDAQITADDGDDVDSDPTTGDDVDEDGDLNGDDDDEDEVTIPVDQVYDLAIDKNLLSAGPFEQESFVTYEIIVTNEGSLDAANVEVTDTPQTGLNYVSSNAGTIANVTETSPGVWVIADLDQTLTETIEVTYQIDATFQGTSLDNDAQITADDGDDVDSDPTTGDDVDEDGDLNGDDDDEDEVTIPVDQVYDLAIDKNLLSAGPFEQESFVTYEIIVTNEGSLDAANVEVTDTPQTGLNYVSSNAGTIANVTETSPGVWVIADLGQTLTETIEVTYQIDATFQGTSLDNDAQITADDGDDVDSDPTTGDDVDEDGDLNGDDDDEDEVTIPVDQVYDLAIDKNLLSAGPFEQESFVTYEIIVTNEGSLDAANIEVTDTPQTGLNYVSSNAGTIANVTETLPGVWVIADLDQALTETIEVTYQIDATFQGTSLDNDAQITADDGDDVDSDPTTGDDVDEDGDLNGDDDDEDEVTIPVDQVYDLAIDKNLLSAGPFEQESFVTYEIIVTNEGSLDAANIEVTDTPQTGLNYVSSNAGTIANVTETLPGVWVIADLDQALTETIEVTYQIDATFQGTSLDNDAQITADDGDDVDSDPTTGDDVDEDGDLNGDDDDEDEVTIPVDQVYDLAIDKNLLSAGPFEQESFVTYEIIVTNEGSLDAANIEVTDTPQTGLNYVSSNAGTIANVTETSPGVWVIADLDQTLTETIEVTYQIDANFQGTSLDNDAQITADDGDDVDSDPTTGDDVDEDGDLNGDDDDEDEVTIPVDQVYDLAIDKNLLSAGPFEQESFVTYEIIVTNEGSLDAANVEVTDTPQTGLNYVSSNAGTIANVTETSPGVWVIADLDQTLTETIEVTYQIDANFQGTSLDNDAQITADDGDDVDSDPTTGDDVDEDGDLNGDDDDEDEVTIPVDQVYDLAIDKNLLSAGPFEQESFVTYEITVANEGSLDAANVEVTDTPQTGLNYVSSNAGTIANVTEISPGVWVIADLDQTLTETIEVTYQIDANFQGTSLDNDAQITADDGDDVDSDPTTGDDVDEDGDLNGDDDDEDEVTIPVDQVYDLAIDKNLLSAGPFEQESFVTYEITVANEGSLDAANVEVTDTPQTGLNYVSSNAGTIANVTEISPGVWVIADLDQTLTETIEVTYQIDANFQGTSLDNDAQITADDGDDVDSDPTTGDDVDEDGDLNGDDDDEDEVTIPVDQVYDLAIDKNLLSAGPFEQESFVTYEIIVTNEGSLDAANVEVTDTPQTGLNYVSSNAGTIANVTETSPGVWVIADLDQTLTETIEVTYQIDADFMEESIDNLAEITADDGDDVDSDPTTSNDIDEDGDLNGDDDDEDVVTIPVGQMYDLALDKNLLSAGPFEQESFVTYEIIVTNEGSLDAANVEVTDTPQAGLTYVSSNAGTIANVTETSPGIWVITDLDQMLTETIEVTYQIDANFQGTSLDNDAQITADDGDDVDSDPTTGDDVDEDGDLNGDDDDEDVVTIPVDQIYDLAIDKNLLSAGPFEQESFVTFEIIVTNEGSLNAANVEVTDTPQTGLTYVSSNAASIANVTETSPGVWVIADLDQALTETIEVTYQIDANFQGTSLDNDAQITVDDGDDVDSDPTTGDDVDEDGDLNGDDDDEDVVTIPVDQIYDLAIDKNLLSAGPFQQESFVTYEIIVTNEGSLDASNIEVTDTPEMGLTYVSSNADTNPNVTEISDGIWVVTNLDQESTETIEVTFQIDADFQGTTLDNVVEITADDGDDIDSDPTTRIDVDEDGDMNGDDDDEDIVTIMVNQIYDLAIDKNLLSAGPFMQGSLVTYEITVTNEGSLNASNIEVTDTPQAGLTYVSSNAASIANVTETSDGVWVLASLDQMLTETIEVTYQIDAGYMGTTLDNEAEITADDGDDVDSDPSTGSDVDEDGDLDGDDDDEDIVQIPVGQIYDLAIDKNLLNSGPFAQDSFVIYEVVITNEGSLDAFNVEITDTPETGLNYFASNADVIANVTETADGIWTVLSLPAGGSQQIVVSYRIDSEFQGTSLDNRVEITADDGDDVDSDPTTGDDVDEDGDLNGDDDDEDIVNIVVDQIYDLAIDKNLLSAGPFMQGSLVTYEVIVTNEGSLNAANVELTDIPQVGLNYSSSNANLIPNVNEISDGIFVVSNLPLGATETVEVTYQVDNEFQGTSLDNAAEITSDNGDDVDSDPDTSSDVDEDGDLNGDDDDEDVVQISIEQVYDLAIDKSIVGVGPFQQESLVTFEITVTNEGSLDASNIEITDTPDAGLTYVSSNAGMIANVTETSDGVWVIADLDQALIEVIQVTYQIDADFMGTSLDNEVEITADDGDDVDSDPDTSSDVDEDGDLNGDDDDEDVVTVMVDQAYDLAVNKTLLSAGPFSQGVQVSYQIDVINEGSLDASNIEVTDTPELGLNYVSSNAGSIANVGEPSDGVWVITNLPFGSTQSIIVTYEIDMMFQGNSLTNEVEITTDDGDDVDSDPSTGPDVDEDGDGNGDDDDEDAVSISIGQRYDLALDKSVLSVGPFMPGSQVTYLIEVINQGSLDAANVEVTDTPALGLTYVSSDALTNANVTEVTDGVWVVADLDQNASEFIEVIYQIDIGFQGNNLQNDAEITADDGDDDDSDPATGPDVDEDGDLDGDDDDEDMTIIPVSQIYDLAIDKSVLTAGPFTQGSLVTYSITVENQGTLNASNVEFADLPQAGLNYVSSNASSNANVTETSDGVFVISALGFGATETIEITYEVDMSFQGTTLVNDVQITMDDGDDIDSDPTTDDGVDEDGDMNGDDDDEDEVIISIDQEYDLAIDKSIVTAGPYAQNSVVTFTITVTNEGSLDASNVEVTDTPQTGLTYVSSNAAILPNVTEVSDGIWTIADLDNGLTQSIEVTYMIDADFQGTSLVNDVEITADDGDDIDSDPTTGDDIDEDGDMNGDDDDEDEVTLVVTQVYDLAIQKTILSAGPFGQGSIITYEILVTNEGSLNASNIEVADMPGTGLTFLSSNAGTLANVTENTDNMWTILSLAGGESQMIEVMYQVDADYQGSSVTNDVQITSDDGDDVDSDPRTGDDIDEDGDMNGDDDDEDEITVPIDQTYDLALQKSLISAGPFNQSSFVTYNITVENEGTLDAADVEVTDLPMTGLNYISSNAASVPNVTEIAAGVWTIADLDAGATQVIEVTYQVDMGFMGLSLTNTAQITADDGDDTDSDPTTDETVDEDMDGNGDDDDEDSVNIVIGNQYDLMIDKSITSTGPYMIGSTVTYEITVRNEGSIDANNVEFIDEPQTGLNYVSSNATSLPNVNETASMVFTVLSLPAGSTETVELTFTIDLDFTGVSLMNSTQITVDDGDDIDSDPDTDEGVDEDGDLDGDDDDEDFAVIPVVQIYDLALTKNVISSGPYSQGSLVIYEIEVTNEGTIDAANIEVTDTPQSGLTFIGSNADTNTNITETSPGTWTIASLLDGDSEVIQVTYRIDDDFQGTSIVNDAEITADDGDDIDSDPMTGDDVDEDGDMDDDDDDEDEEIVTVDQIYDLAIDKSILSAGPFMVGSQITFQIEVINEGSLDATDIEVTDVPETGFTFVSSNASSNPNVTEVSDGVWIVTDLEQNSSEFIEVTYEIAAGVQSTSLVNDVLITADNGDDIDSNPATGDDVDEDGDMNGDDDDEDEVIVPIGQVYDLAIDKTVLTTGPFMQGSQITYEIVVTNEGTLNAANIQVVDTPASGLVYVSSNANVLLNVVETSDGVWTVASLDQSQTQSIEVTYEIAADFQGTTLVNDVQITFDDGDDVDSNPDTDDSVDEDGDMDGDDDDEDEVAIVVNQVYDLAIDKGVLTAGPYTQGSQVTYIINVTNEGSLNAGNVEVTDTPGLGLSYVSSNASGNANVTETSDGVWVISVLDQGTTEMIEVTYEIDANFQGTSLVNDVQITADDGDDVDSDPSTGDDIDEDGDMNGDDDDEDEVTIPVDQQYDLALSKNTISTGPYVQGSQVTYEIVVTNEGSLDASNIEVTDTPETGLTFVSSNAAANVNVIEVGVGVWTITNLDQFATETIEVTYEIDVNFQGSSLNNTAQITLDDGDDIDSDPDTGPDVDEDGDMDGDDDDEDNSEIIVDQEYDLAITKGVISTGPYSQGSQVTYEIVVTNEGSLDATNVEVTDIPEIGLNYVSSNASGNANVTESTDGVWVISSLLNGSTETIEVTFEIDMAFQGTSLTNDVEITIDDGDDIDSDPDTGNDVDEDGDLNGDDDDEDGVTVVIGQVYDLALSKNVISAGPYTQGTLVTYEINVTNEGSLNASNVEVTDTPETGLNYVSSNASSNANVTETSSGVWSIASLSQGASESIEVTYEVDPDFQGTNLSNDAQITADDGDDTDSDPDTGNDVDEDGDMDGDDDDEG